MYICECVWVCLCVYNKNALLMFCHTEIYCPAARSENLKNS